MTDLPLDRAYHWERTTPDTVFLTQPMDGVIHHWTWSQAMNEARRLAAYLGAQKWTPASKIVIYSQNCAWWIMADLAIWMAGHVTVPIYPSLTAASVHQLIEYSDAVACFIGPIEDATADAVPKNILRVRFPNAPRSEAVAWEEIRASTAPLTANPSPPPNAIATLIYTSGTTGTPKGAMHAFRTFPAIAAAVAQMVGNAPERALSYLPLAHIAERGLLEMSAIYFSWHLYFTQGISTFMTDLARARVTLFFSVPRLYVKFQQRVHEKIPRVVLSPLLRVPLLNHLIGRIILKQMGLADATHAASGSAALSRDLLLWYRSLGLALTEGYGTTETGITHTPPAAEFRPGYVGRYAPGVEAKLSADGELLLRSPMNMVGYYKNEQASREVFTSDGFIRTGDLAEITGDGWLKITGRLKEQFKTAKGKYVSPAHIETLLSANEAVDQSLVMGTSLAAPFAVIVLTTEALKRASSEEGRNSLAASFQELLDTVNGELEGYEKLAFLVLVDTRWTIDSGFITPTLKVKRSPLELFYSPHIEEWTRAGKKVIWRLSQPAP